MPLNNFNPNYKITNKITQDLIKIASAKEAINNLPITPTVIGA